MESHAAVVVISYPALLCETLNISVVNNDGGSNLGTKLVQAHNLLAQLGRWRLLASINGVAAQCRE